jgi:NitT/TauT family transport system ATP-binding protein
LLSVTTGLSKPTSGEVFVEGQPLNGPYARCGIAFQTPVLLEWRTVIDNVLIQFELRNLPASPHREAAKALLASMGLDGAENLYPRELSGGMKQRVSIARALIHDPPILFLDEPFAAVDAITRDQLKIDLQQLWLDRGHDLTIILITHGIDEAVFLSDRIAVMTPRPGAIAEMVQIDLPRPRRFDQASARQLAEYSADVRSLFEKVGVYHAQRSNGKETS